MNPENYGCADRTKKVYYYYYPLGSIIIPRTQSLCTFLALVFNLIKMSTDETEKTVHFFKWFILDKLSEGELINLLEFDNRLTMNYHSD